MGSPGSKPGGTRAASPSAPLAQPRSWAEHIIPALSTPRSLVWAISRPVPGVLHPTGCILIMGKDGECVSECVCVRVWCGVWAKVENQSGESKIQENRLQGPGD